MLENMVDLSGTAEEWSFFEEGCTTSQLMLLSHQRVRASLSTRAGGFGLSSAEARRMSASVESMLATVPEVLADLSGIAGGISRVGSRRPHLEERQRPPRRARGFGGSHGYRAGTLA